MSEFAFSGVGLTRTSARRVIRPHWRSTVPSACGGSSSGAAASVALGLAVAGLGSDTGGSIRIPAALTGIVGFKNTQARTPLAGAYPLASTLDTACAMTRSVADALLVDGIAAGAPLAVQRRELRAKLALPRTLMLDALDAAVAHAFERAAGQFSAAGAEVHDEIALAELAEIAGINAPGGLSPIEAYAGTANSSLHTAPTTTRAWRRASRSASRCSRPTTSGSCSGARTGSRASGSASPASTRSSARWCRSSRRRGNWLVASDEAFFKANGLLLRNTFAINFLDGCLFSLPCHEAGELPVGLMLSAPRGHDAALAGVALAVEAALATGTPAGRHG
ncbi:MAG: amidase family protein [Rubrivivax sp.]